MTQKQYITMSKKELSRHVVIKNLEDGKINGTEASKQLNLSTRQIRRIKTRFKKFGIEGLIHGSRGKKSNRRVKSDILEKIIELLKEKYYDFGPTFATEKLNESHEIEINKESVRQIMINEKLWKPKPRKVNKKYRSWRPRKEQHGEMLQFDGSYHKWFEDRAPECCLLASIDDATGKIIKVMFDYNEGIVPVFTFWKGYIEIHGKPLNIYLDKFSTYKINHKSAVDNKELMTQFGRAMKDLDINLITAHSPQAKGRVERLFKTLQDRLIKELRLRNISDIETANKFLEDIFIPEFNKRFSVVPQKNGDLHKELTEIDKKSLDRIFSIQNTRVVNNDFTISYNTRWLQLDLTQPTLVLRKSRVLVEERIDASIHISLKEKELNFKELPERPKKVANMKLVALSKAKPAWIPPKNHPWRDQFLYGKLKQTAQTLTTKN